LSHYSFLGVQYVIQIHYSELLVQFLCHLLAQTNEDKQRPDTDGTPTLRLSLR